MKTALMIVLIVALAAITAFSQAPTLRIVTEDPALPSELFYGNIKVKPLRLRPGTNPPVPITIDDADFFASQHYVDFLRRFADAPGLAHWTNNVTTQTLECNDSANRVPGETIADCAQRKRANTSAAFFLSPEFQNTGSFVVRVYWGTLGKAPNTPKSACPSLPDGFSGQCRPLYSDYITDMRQVANGIVVNDQLDPARINANKRAFVDQFVTRTDFTARYAGLTSAQFVDRLFETTLATPTSSERQALIDELNAGAPNAKSSVVFKVVDGTTTLSGGALRFDTTYGQAFYNKEFDDAFVFMEYVGYLRRNPDQGGYEHWLGKLKQYGNWNDAEMVLAFIRAPEYRNRF